MRDVATGMAFASVVGAASLLALTARRFRPGRELPSLEGWSLADRTLGPGWTWLLLGGTVFTAYIFAAVPGLVFSEGAAGFSALPYTVIVGPLAFALLPRLWSAARARGHVTVADLVRGRYGSPALALAVACTGILTTVICLVLQLVAVRAVVATSGLCPPGVLGDLVLVALFAVPTAATYLHGLRAPTVVSGLKALAVFSSAVTAVTLALHRLGGPGALFEAVPHRPAVPRAAAFAVLLSAPGQQSAFATVALGSAMALLMCPHVLTVGFAASGPKALRQAAVGLQAWTAVLALFGLLGVAAASAAVETPAGRAEAAVPRLVQLLLPAPLAGAFLGALTVAALVPVAVMSIAVASLFVRSVYAEYLRPLATPKRQVRVARTTSVLAQTGAGAFALWLGGRGAVHLQLLGSAWALQTVPAVTGGLFTRGLHRRALFVGWGTGVAAGTAVIVGGGFSPVVAVPLGPHRLEISSGLAALALNVAVSGVLTAVFHRFGTRAASPEHPPSPVRGTIRP